MRTRPPKAKKPGAGLGHLFPSEEPKTAKVPTLLSDDDPKILCPVCNGELHALSRDNKATECALCHATGSVAREMFDTYVADHPECAAARQLAAKRGETP